jgi:hypothetical protein
MNLESFIIFGWEEYELTRVINNNWLLENNIDIFSLEIKRNIPIKIVYGVICDFSEQKGLVNIDNINKSNVITAFNKINNNYIKLRYYIVQKINYNYNSYYNSYNPSELLYEDSLDTNSTCISNNSLEELLSENNF